MTATGEASTTGARRSDQTLARLFAAATAVIAEDGWDNTSSRRVADRAGLSLGVVHYHFDSIDELRRRAAIGVIERFFAEATAVATEPPASADDQVDPASAIRRLFNALAAGDPHRSELNVLYQSLVVAVRDDQLRAELASLIRDYRTSVENWLAERGVGQAKRAAFAIVAAVDGFLLQRALDPDLDPQPVADGLAQLAVPQTDTDADT